MSVGETEFQAYKATAVVASFAFAALIQWLLPVSGQRRGIIQSWRVNLPLATVNVTAVSMLCGGCICALAHYAATHGYGLMNMIGVTAPVAMVISVFALDLMAWVWHMANHRIPLLWRFHLVHHSDPVYDTSTAARFHIGEIMISLIVRSAVVALIGIPVSGILAFEIVYAFFNFMEHGSIALPQGLSRALRTVFITPALHRIHHSRAKMHSDANFGTILSVWDRLARTLTVDIPIDRYAVGLSTQASWPESLKGVLKHPFGTMN